MSTQDTYDMEFQTRHQGAQWKPTTLRAALSGRGLAAKTVKDYFNAIMRAQEWLKERAWTLDDVPAPVLSAYCDTLPRSRSTRNMLRCALVSYWELTGRDPAPVGAIRVPRMPTFKSRALSPEDASTLARAAYEWDRGPEGLASLLALYMGMRAFEIAKTRWDEFSDDYGEITFVGKWGTEATLPVHPLVVRRLEWWREFRKPDPTIPLTEPGPVYLFPGKSPTCKSESAHPSTVLGWVKRVAETVGIETTTHVLRHTCLTELNDRTKDLRAVQDFARHRDPETTSRYTRVTSDRLRELSDALTY